ADAVAGKGEVDAASHEINMERPAAARQLRGGKSDRENKCRIGLHERRQQRHAAQAEYAATCRDVVDGAGPAAAIGDGEGHGAGLALRGVRQIHGVSGNAMVASGRMAVWLPLGGKKLKPKSGCTPMRLRLRETGSLLVSLKLILTVAVTLPKAVGVYRMTNVVASLKFMESGRLAPKEVVKSVEPVTSMLL